MCGDCTAKSNKLAVVRESASIDPRLQVELEGAASAARRPERPEGTDESARTRTRAARQTRRKPPISMGTGRKHGEGGVLAHRRPGYVAQQSTHCVQI